MKKVIILPLSLYMDNQQQRTVATFKAMGVGSLELFWHYLPIPKFLERFLGKSLPTLFDQYRRGELTTEAFRQDIRQRFPNAQLNDDVAFDAAWNAMQVVTDTTKAAFKEAQTLVDQGYQVYLLAGTNPLHIQDIKNKSGLAQLPGIAYLSHEQKQLGRNLFTSLLRTIRADHKNIKPDDIAFFYTPPKDPYPRLGKFAWLNPLAIVKNVEYLQARKYVASLQKEATSANGFKLIACDPKADKKPNIIKHIEKLDWKEMAKIGQELKPTSPVTPLRNVQRVSPRRKSQPLPAQVPNSKDKKKVPHPKLR